jgi:hypothetical protein
MFQQVSEPARWRRGWRCAIECALLGALLCAVVPAARASDDPKAASADLSNQAFALLNSLNAGGAHRGANPLLGQVAGFAGDAQTLSQALSAGDKGGAGRAMASLESDAASLEAALKARSSCASVRRAAAGSVGRFRKRERRSSGNSTRNGLCARACERRRLDCTGCEPAGGAGCGQRRRSDHQDRFAHGRG